MKNINRLKFLLSLVLILIISCSKVDNSVKESFDKAEPISMAIMSSMVNIKEALSQKNIDSNYVKLEMRRNLERSIAYMEILGISKSDLNKDFGSLDNFSIIYAYLMVNENKESIIQNSINGYSEYVSLSELFIQKSFAIEPDWVQVSGCAIEALGIQGIFELATGRAMSAAALTKAVSKAASRSLGAIGAAFAVYDFGECMDYW